MSKYIALLFLLLSFTANAQRTLQVYDPDFDSAYCMHQAMYEHSGEERPIHYSQFYSRYHRNRMNNGSLTPYYDSGFMLQQTVTGIKYGHQKTEYSEIRYNNNRHSITVNIIDSTANLIVNGEQTYNYDDKKLLRSKEIATNVIGNVVVSYQYDAKNRITHIYNQTGQNKKLLHRFIYEEGVSDTLMEEWHKLQIAACNAARAANYKLNKSLKKISEPDKIRKMLSRTDIQLLKQFDSIDKSTVFIFSSPDLIYSFKYLPNPNLYVFQTMNGIDLYILKNARVVQHRSCYFSFGCMSSYYSQTINKKHNRGWKEWYAYDKKRLKKNKITNAVHAP